jgi:hypothetical protein
MKYEKSQAVSVLKLRVISYLAELQRCMLSPFVSSASFLIFVSFLQPAVKHRATMHRTADDPDRGVLVVLSRDAAHSAAARSSTSTSLNSIASTALLIAWTCLRTGACDATSSPA